MMFAKKLKEGDHIRVIAPAESFSSKMTDELKQQGINRLKQLGLEVSFGKYVHKQGTFKSASVKERLEDLHEAFEDDTVDAVLSANGGSSANQLLKHMDYDLIKRKKKIFCGLSDITEMTSAIHAQTGLVTYYGPHFTMLSASSEIEPVLDNMKATFFSEEPVNLEPPQFYSNGEWDDEKILNPGFWTINEGEIEAECIGGNMLTFNFLLGYQFASSMKNRVLFLEENHLIDYRGIQKELQQILNHPEGKYIKGIIIGRFQRESGMSRELLTEMVKTKKELENLPVVGNVDCSHTTPMYTFPYGGTVRISAGAGDRVQIELTKH